MMGNPSKFIDAQQIETSIMMRKQYAGEDQIVALIDVLESIAEDPRNDLPACRDGVFCEMEYFV